MRTHDEFWQAAFRRATESLKREGIDLDGWTLETRAANDPAAEAMVNGEGGFIDATVGHADPKRRVLTLFVHEFVWDEARIAEHVGGMAASPENSPEAAAAWWLVESLRSISTRIRNAQT
jgi:hypothetical protein